MMIKQTHRVVIAIFIALLSACSSWVDKGDGPPSTPPGDLTGTPDAVPKVEPVRAANQKSYVVFGKRYYPMSSNAGYREKGVASWYGKQFHGNPTATGEKYNMYAMTAAHKTLPLPSYVEVRNLDTGRKIVVRVNDRGPFHGDRIIDLSYAAASKLGIVGKGTGRVEVVAVDARNYPATQYVEKTPTVKVTPVPKIQPTTSVAMTKVSPISTTMAPSVYLQIGTFSSLARAESLMKDVARHVSSPVFLMPLYQSTGALYRVRVGPLASVDASEELARTLQSLGVRDSHAVVE